ncbi:MAG: hypothetical protein IIB09_04000 [Bacteroidetes bacterium]|nr:hypothetical protein [Bacteroidota bacterium]
MCLLDTVNCAIHACVIANRNTGAWKVLYFPEFADPGEPYRSRIWDPTDPDDVSAPQDIPPWPGVFNPDPSNIFCCGHSHMENGELLVAGGQRPSVSGCPNAPRGLTYTFVFDPISEAWSVAGSPGPPRRPPAARRDVVR